MLQATHRKTTVFLIGMMIVSLIACLYLLQTNAGESPRARQIPPTALPSDVTDDPILGVFEGTTPCSGVNRPLPQIPENTNCEQMIWKLTLDQDTATGQPTTYQLASAYGLPQQGTTGLQRGAVELNLEGKWTQQLGTDANPNAVIYRLNPDDPQGTINFIRLDDNILHLLAGDQRLMVGNGAWSYTLNRTDKRIITTPAAPSNTPTAPLTTNAATSGMFEGRIPCAESILALNNIAPSACQRVKLQLTLHADSETGAPSTYELLTVYVGTGDTQYKNSGRWAILHGTPSDPQAVVYQLNPADSQPPISLLQPDENLLFLMDSDFNLMVGDALTSYTLNRADE